jgi:hypothetical protein
MPRPKFPTNRAKSCARPAFRPNDPRVSQRRFAEDLEPRGVRQVPGKPCGLCKEYRRLARSMFATLGIFRAQGTRRLSFRPGLASVIGVRPDGIQGPRCRARSIPSSPWVPLKSAEARIATIFPADNWASVWYRLFFASHSGAPDTPAAAVIRSLAWGSSPSQWRASVPISSPGLSVF